MKKTIAMLSLLVCSCSLAWAQQPLTTEERMEEVGLVRLSDVDPTIEEDLLLARPDNPAGTALYTDLSAAYLHPQAALALKKAQAALKRTRPDLSLKVYDAARPMSVQGRLYAAVAGTTDNLYVSDPRTGGDQHNYGLAVDVTLCDAETGDTLAMGTRIGDFCAESGLAGEEQRVVEGALTQEALDNRRLLRRVMAIGGYKTLRNEWWHFNFRTRSEAKANFKVIK